MPEARAIVVAAGDADGVHKTLEAGAKGFVLHSDVDATLAPTVRAVRAVQLVVPPRAHASAVRPPLSHREKETLSLLGVRSRHEAIARARDPSVGLVLDATLSNTP